MIAETTTFGLQSRAPHAPTPVLCGVQATGRLEGVLFDLTLRQTYRNTSDRTLEVVYTFPLPVQALLLGFASELNGTRQVGRMVARRDAEREYEEALAEGDAPVMVEAHSNGLHTANIGNLKPGDELVLEVRFAQVLAFEQGRLRLAIPTTIAPRYGSAESAGLQPQQVPQLSLLQEYPLLLSVTIAGVLAGGLVECPTHRFTRTAVDGDMRLDLTTGAWLDRDVVIVVQPRDVVPSLVIQSRDTAAEDAPVVVMAALRPQATSPRTQIALKLLVDCSGSMGGDSIASARAALHGALAGLTRHDQVSVSCFGSTVEHVLAPSACTPQTLRGVTAAINAIDATLGGTEMAAALQAVFELPVSTECAGADVLLVTDGEIWQAEEMIAAARASGHRVFAIGVGSSPAEGVLRSLAEATGGACEFATPGEALEAAAGRMMARIRQQTWRDARIDWGCEPIWQTPLPGSVFGGDTVIVFAGMPTEAQTKPVRLIATAPAGTVSEVAVGEADVRSPGDTLSRIAAARRIATATDAEGVTLALTYQLMSRYTNCIVVHERAEADKATEEAELRRVSSMLAAGWGATSHVGGERTAMLATHAPFVNRSNILSAFADVSDIHASPRLSEPVMGENPASLTSIALAVVDHLAQGGELHELAAHCQFLALHPDVRAALDHVIALGISDGQALLLLAHWTNVRTNGLASASITAALQSHVDGVDSSLRAASIALFARWLGGYALDGWTPSRTRRLRRAAARVVP